MTATPAVLLVVYCLAVALFSLMGGLLPNWVRMTHTRTQIMMSFVSGLMLGVAFYHMVPHSLVLVGGVAAADITVWWLMIGLIAMLLLLRMFHFHQHDFSTDDHAHGLINDQGHSHEHAREHGHAHAQHHARTTHAHSHGHAQAGNGAHKLSWIGIGLGLAVHTIIDGVALGAVMQGASGNADQAGLLGIGVFLAILLHKPLDAMSITTVMEAGGWNSAARKTVNIVFALMCPLGALLFFFGVDLLETSRYQVIGIALAFSAGAFICIALSDLLPEVQFHSHDRGKLTLAFLLGITLAYAIGSVEPDEAHFNSAQHSEGTHHG